MNAFRSFFQYFAKQKPPKYHGLRRTQQVEELGYYRENIEMRQNLNIFRPQIIIWLFVVPYIFGYYIPRKIQIEEDAKKGIDSSDIF